MKPTSIIFIILSAVLIVVGVITCVVSASSANSKGIELICDTVDKDGNAVTTDDLSEYDIINFEIKMKEVDINIIGGSESSYIEFVNLNPAIYNYKFNNGKLELENNNPFDLLAGFSIRGNSAFSGLRSYLYLNKYEDVDSWINIYVKDSSAIEKFTLTLTDGEVTVKNIAVNSAYNLKVTGGNIKFENAESSRESNIIIKNGNLEYVSSALSKLNFEVNKGNADFKCSRQCRLDLSCNIGSINMAGENMGESIQDQIFPPNEQFETTYDAYGEEVRISLLPVGVSGKVNEGNITLTDISAE